MSYAMEFRSDQSSDLPDLEPAGAVLPTLIHLSLALLAAAFVVATGAAEAQQQPRRPAAPATKPAQRAAPAPQAPPAAQNTPSGPRALGTFETWTAIELVERTGKICYMVGRPSQSEPKGARRGEVMLTVSHRPAQNQQNQVSYHAGYTYKGGSPVVVEIERKKFEMFTRPEVDPEAAWTQDANADKAIVDAMRNGKTLTVKGTSARGTETLDTIPLAGFSRALGEISKACGVK